LNILKANSADIDTILNLIDSAAVWLHEIGIDYQWAPDKVYQRRDHFAALADSGKFYRVQHHDRTVATFMLDWVDDELWEDDGSAGYLGYFTVDRAYAGEGVGRYILAWVAEQVVNNHRSKLRLDCVAENSSLNRYYQSQGFVQVGQFRYSDGVDAVLYEKRLN